MLEKLTEGHDYIRHVMTEFTALLDSADTGRIDELTKMRVDFSRFFRQHTAADKELAGRMMECGDPDIRQIGKTYFERLAKLYLQLSSQVRLWSPESIVRDWQGYEAGTRILRGCVCELME